MGQILKGVGGRKYVFVAILYQKRNKRFRCVQQRNWVCCTRAIKNYVLYWVCCTVGIKDYFIFWVSCTDYFIFWVCCTIFHFLGLLHIRNKRLFHLLDLLHGGNKSLCCGHQRNWICCTGYVHLLHRLFHLLHLLHSDNKSLCCGQQRNSRYCQTSLELYIWSMLEPCQ